MKKSGYFSKELENKTYQLNVLYKMKYPMFLVKNLKLYFKNFKNKKKFVKFKFNYQFNDQNNLAWSRIRYFCYNPHICWKNF